MQVDMTTLQTETQSVVDIMSEAIEVSQKLAAVIIFARFWPYIALVLFMAPFAMLGNRKPALIIVTTIGKFAATEKQCDADSI